MIICIIKDGKIYARTDGDGMSADYTLQTFDTAPDYPAQSAGTGKYWDLQIVDGDLAWVAVERELTIEEKVDKMEQDMEKLTQAWKVGESVVVGDVRYYIDTWYKCIQAHTTQADWTPDRVPALWQALLNIE